MPFLVIIVSEVAQFGRDPVGSGSAGDLQVLLHRVEADDAVITGPLARVDDVPFLVVAAVTRVLVHEGARDGGGPVDVQHQPAVDVGELVIAAANVCDLPLLVGPAVVRVLVHDGPGGGGEVVNLEHLARVPVDDVIVPVPDDLRVGLPCPGVCVDVPLVVPGQGQGGSAHL